MTKLSKVEFYVFGLNNLDDAGGKEIIEELECCAGSHYDGNHVIGDIVTKDIGEWDDDHPLNHGDTQLAYCRKLFGDEVPIAPGTLICPQCGNIRLRCGAGNAWCDKCGYFPIEYPKVIQ